MDTVFGINKQIRPSVNNCGYLNIRNEYFTNYTARVS